MGAPSPPPGWSYIAAVSLWWSDKDEIYLDTTKGHYWDHASRHWYDPAAKKWFKPEAGTASDKLPKSRPATENGDAKPPTAAGEPAKESNSKSDAKQEEDKVYVRLNAEHADYEFDEGSGYYYSEKYDIYKDPESGMRFCSNTNKWYDPQTHEWCESE